MRSLCSGRHSGCWLVKFAAAVVSVTGLLTCATRSLAQEPVESGQVIMLMTVPFDAAWSREQAMSAREGGGQAEVLRAIDATGEVIVRTPAGMSDADFALRLSKVPGVVYAQPDWVLFAAEASADPLAQDQWHLSRSEVPQAWALLEEGLPTVHAYRPIVAIVDSGVYLTHPDLSSILVPGFTASASGERRSMAVLSRMSEPRDTGRAARG